MLPVVVRMADPEAEELLALVWRRYPDLEWATFLRFGWRETAGGLVLTLAAVDPPHPGDLNERVGHVAIDEAYTLRTALGAEAHPLAVGVVHSHPEDCAPRPSIIDDDMDTYYARYYADFAPGRPYVSLIVSRMDGELVMSGRVYWRGAWHVVERVIAERRPVTTWGLRVGNGDIPEGRARTARLSAAFGDNAARSLRASTVAVIGAGGTGSAVIETLVRAGVGRLIIVDPDVLDESNLERVHGSVPEDAAQALPKALIALRHARDIDSSCDVTAFVGAMPQREVVDAVVGANVVIGCTDQQHSRLALSDLAVRYLVPGLDCGVTLEGRDGVVRGQVIQLLRVLSADPCALCRGMIVPTRIAQELMSEGERTRRRQAAGEALERGGEAGGYWHEMPQLNTVGYLTTATGALIAGYAIGWLTGRFDTPFTRLQMNLVAPFFDVTDVDSEPRSDCTCRSRRGWADQGNADALMAAPTHWPVPRRLMAEDIERWPTAR